MLLMITHSRMKDKSACKILQICQRFVVELISMRTSFLLLLLLLPPPAPASSCSCFLLLPPIYIYIYIYIYIHMSCSSTGTVKSSIMGTTLGGRSRYSEGGLAILSTTYVSEVHYLKRRPTFQKFRRPTFQKFRRPTLRILSTTYVSEVHLKQTNNYVPQHTHTHLNYLLVMC